MKHKDIHQQQRELRQVLAGILKKTFDSIDDALDSMDAKDRLTFTVKLLPYFLPKMDIVDDPYKPHENGWSEYVQKAIEKTMKTIKKDQPG